MTKTLSVKVFSIFAHVNVFINQSPLLSVTMSAALELEEGNEALLGEVQALRAIYGEGCVTTSRGGRNVDGRAYFMISIDLSTHMGQADSNESVTLSAQLPPAYPEDAPRTPTLAASNLTSAEAAHVVAAMLSRRRIISGEVCLFEYCEGVLNELHDADTMLRIRSQSSSSRGGGSLRLSGTEATAALEDGRRGEHGDDVGPDIDSVNVSTVALSLVHGTPLTDRKSVFQAHAARVASGADAQAIARAVRTGRKGAAATHIMWAYRLVSPDGHVVQDGDDDGEKGAAKTMLHVLQQSDARNVGIAVSRWFGGIKLGPARFRHIASVTRDAIDTLRDSDSDHHLTSGNHT